MEHSHLGWKVRGHALIALITIMLLMIIASRAYSFESNSQNEELPVMSVMFNNHSLEYSQSVSTTALEHILKHLNDLYSFTEITDQTKPLTEDAHLVVMLTYPPQQASEEQRNAVWTLRLKGNSLSEDSESRRLDLMSSLHTGDHHRDPHPEDHEVSLFFKVLSKYVDTEGESSSDSSCECETTVEHHHNDSFETQYLQRSSAPYATVEVHVGSWTHISTFTIEQAENLLEILYLADDHIKLNQDFFSSDKLSQPVNILHKHVGHEVIYQVNSHHEDELVIISTIYSGEYDDHNTQQITTDVIQTSAHNLKGILYRSDSQLTENLTPMNRDDKRIAAFLNRVSELITTVLQDTQKNNSSLHHHDSSYPSESVINMDDSLVHQINESLSTQESSPEDNPNDTNHEETEESEEEQSHTTEQTAEDTLTELTDVEMIDSTESYRGQLIEQTSETAQSDDDEPEPAVEQPPTEKESDVGVEIKVMEDAVENNLIQPISPEQTKETAGDEKSSDSSESTSWCVLPKEAMDTVQMLLDDPNTDPSQITLSLSLANNQYSICATIHENAE